MDLSAYMRLDTLAQMQDLKDISEAVQEYTDRELYMEVYGANGDFSIQNILQDCYLLVLGELSNLGLHFTRDDDEMVEDWYTAKTIYCLAYVFSTVQIQTWIVKSELLAFVEDILNSDEKIDIAQAILDKITEAHKGQMEYDVLAEHTDEIVSTENFKEYIQSFVEWARDTDRDMITPDAARAKAYIEHIQGLRNAAKAAVEKIFAKYPGYRGNLDQKKINKLLADYDLDKLSPSDIHIYSLIDGKVEVPPALVSYKIKWMDIHHARSLHHWDYWEKHRDRKPTLENLIVLAAHYSEPDTTADSFWDEINKDAYRINSILTEQQKTAFLEMAEALFPRPSNDPRDLIPTHAIH